MDIARLSLGRGNGEALILQLPDEVLSQILEMVAHADCRSPAVRFPSLVCRRFNRIAAPYLYSHLKMLCDDFEQDKTHILHQTLRENPDLRPFCKSLQVAISQRSHRSTFLYSAADLIKWLTSTTKIQIENRGKAAMMTEAYFLLGLAVQHMPRLKAILFDSSEPDVNLSELVDILGDQPNGSIRHLSISGVSNNSDPTALDKLKERAGTATFTELSLHTFLQSPDALMALMKWPARLEAFSLGYTLRKGRKASGRSFWRMATLQRALNIHRDTLRSVRIYCIHQGGLENFDVSGFPNLNELSLSLPCTGTDPGLVAGLVAPRLRVFRWDLAPEDQQLREHLEDFAQPHETWLRALCDAAVASGSELSDIFVKFSPEPYVSWQVDGGLDSLVYPWDRMDSIGRDIGPRGIKLHYIRPTMTRPEFEQGVRTAKYVLKIGPKAYFESLR